MKNNDRLNFARFGALLALTATAAFLGAPARAAGSDGDASDAAASDTAVTDTPSRPDVVDAGTSDAASLVADWPETARLTAMAMIAAHGQPQRSDAQSLTWFGLYNGKKTVVHRVAEGEPTIEQTVLYRVPDDKAAALADFDSRITIDKDSGEISARTDSESTNFLVLNLAHEIASGFKTVDQAKEFYDRQMQLAEAGKTSRYRDELLFAEPLPHDGDLPRRDEFEP